MKIQSNQLIKRERQINKNNKLKEEERKQKKDAEKLKLLEVKILTILKDLSIYSI